MGKYISDKYGIKDELYRFPDVWVSPTLEEISEFIEEGHRMSAEVEAELRAVLIEKLAELEDWQKEALCEEFRWYHKVYPDRQKHWWWLLEE